MKAARRKALPDSAFAYKNRTYPIDTVKRARAALSLAGKRTTRGSYSHVAKAVRAKYGDRIASVGPTKGTTTRPGYRKRSSS